MRFTFSAHNKKGKVQKGIVESYSKESAVEILNEKGLTPISITEERQALKAVKSLQRLMEGVSQKDLMLFFRQLHTLIKARVPVVYSLRAIADQTKNNYFKAIIYELTDDVEDGTPLSDSMAKYPKVFSPLVHSTINAGEVSGNLHESIKFIADSIEKNYRLSSKIKGALFYPAFVIGAAIIMGFLASIVVLPRLTKVIESMDVEVPWYTNFIIAFGDFMSSYWWVVILVVIILIGSLIYYMKTEEGKRALDDFKLRIPIVGKLFKYIYIVRFSSNFSMLLNGGTPVVKALTIVASVVNNSTYKSIILKSADEVRAGGNINTVFSKSPHIPVVVSRMLKIGEDTGKTTESLSAITHFYEGEVEDIVKSLASLIEPVLIVILGIGVAILVFAILLPIYNVVGQF